jgi:hypothetical protein
MFKRLMVSSIFALSLVAIFWWTEANAVSNCKPGQPNCRCVTWTNVGGSRMCAEWRTKGILVELTFYQNCESVGEGGSTCGASIFVESENSIAFCVNPANPVGPPSRTTCNEDVTFSGPADQCEPKHDQDNDGVGGKGHDKGNHACTSTTAFETPDNPASCQAACTTAGLGAVVDVVPIEMDTTVSAFALGDPNYYGDGEGLTQCPPGSPACGMEQHCTIDPKKIQFGAIRPYQCVITNIFVPVSD